MTKRWEYEFIEFSVDSCGVWMSDCFELEGKDYESIIEALCAVGELGWEMCGSNPHSNDCAWTFKRPVSED
jgi:hypothetical protein